MYKVKQFGSGSEPAGCLSKQQLSNQARFKAATAKKNSPSRSFVKKNICTYLYLSKLIVLSLPSKTFFSQNFSLWIWRMCFCNKFCCKDWPENDCLRQLYYIALCKTYFRILHNCEGPKAKSWIKVNPNFFLIRL